MRISGTHSAGRSTRCGSDRSRGPCRSSNLHARTEILQWTRSAHSAEKPRRRTILLERKYRLVVQREILIRHAPRSMTGLRTAGEEVAWGGGSPAPDARWLIASARAEKGKVTMTLEHASAHVPVSSTGRHGEDNAAAVDQLSI